MELPCKQFVSSQLYGDVVIGKLRQAFTTEKKVLLQRCDNAMSEHREMSRKECLVAKSASL